ncbi:hypothetical protein [Streptomyces acidiscabies]|uniref:hypothetical protein n=1 Tax=Streptomyces acidiscabies TaxID=42234 RepID=UPI000952B353|nr:hypothetical protein [Streptomyces acidiscabies]
MTNDSPNVGQAADLRALLEGVRTALTLPYDDRDYDRRMLDRAALVRTTLDGALADHPNDIGWDVGYLARKVLQEEQAAVEREATRCRRCRKPFEGDGTRFDGRARYRDTAWCRSCVDNCHDGGTEHTCVICEPSRYSQPPTPKGDAIERSVRNAFPAVATFLDTERGETP